MPDREKVIAVLTLCANGEPCYKDKYKNCLYSPIGKAVGYNCGGAMAADALTLLRGQTAQWIWDRPHHFRCSGCNSVVGQRTYLYCPNCGREMSLEERERKKEWPD